MGESQIRCHDVIGDNRDKHTDDDTVNATSGSQPVHLKAETLNRTLRRTRFGSGYGPVVRQTAE